MSIFGRNKAPQLQPLNPYGVSHAPQQSQEPSGGEGVSGHEGLSPAQQYEKDSGARATAEVVELATDQNDGQIETDGKPESELGEAFAHDSGELVTEQLVEVGGEAHEVIDDRSKMEKLADDCISQAEKIRLMYSGPSGQKFYTADGQDLKASEMRRPSSKHYGQGYFVDQENPTRVPEQFRREINEDGTTRIYYTAFSYRDISGRPGAKLEIDFTLPTGIAENLEDSIQPGLEDFSEVMEKVIDSSRPQYENWTGPTLWQRIKAGRRDDVQGEQKVLQIVVEEEDVDDEIIEINAN